MGIESECVEVRSARCNGGGQTGLNNETTKGEPDSSAFEFASALWNIRHTTPRRFVHEVGAERRATCGRVDITARCDRLYVGASRRSARTEPIPIHPTTRQRDNAMSGCAACRCVEAACYALS